MERNDEILKNSFDEKEKISYKRICGKVKLFITIFMVLGIIILDISHNSIGFFDSEKIRGLLQVDYEKSAMVSAEEFLKKCQGNTLP